MDDQFSADTTALRRGAADRREQSSQVATAATRIANLSVTAFTPGVKAQMDSWVSQWHSTVRAIADEAGEVGTHLESAADAYECWDAAAQAAFQNWLEDPS